MYPLASNDLKELSAIVISMLQQKNSSSAIRRIDNVIEWGYIVSIYDVGDVLRIDIKRDKKDVSS
jgi:hypothetical protein